MLKVSKLYGKDFKNKKGLLYHLSDNDLDGCVPTVLSNLGDLNTELTIKKENFAYHNAYTINDVVPNFLKKLTKDDVLVITDVSTNEENAKLIDSMVQDGFTIILLDHHKTAFYLNEFSWADVIAVDENNVLTCGASLYYQFLIESGVIESCQWLDELVELTRLYDTWDWTRTVPETTKAKNLNDIFGILKYQEVFRARMLELYTRSGQFEFSEKMNTALAFEEDALKDALKHANENLLKKKIQINDDVFNVGIHFQRFKSNFGSVIGNELNNKNQDLDFVIIVDVNAKRMSMRSNKSHVDLSKICKLFGGGGHAPAAGCSLNEEWYQALSPFNETYTFVI